MNKNLFVSLEQALKKDPRFISNDEHKILLKNVIRQAAEQLDESLISLLLDDSSLREVFFKPISDVIVFDSRKFITFLNNKEFLPDSYTAFKNKVGLSNTAWDYLAGSDEVVLSFPYKDCVLAGWQDKEDTKRQEVFYNEILGRDDIDRLLDSKTFTNFKKYKPLPNPPLKGEGIWVAEEKLSGFTRGDDWVIKDNLIIKGNNLLALHSLKKEFAGKVKLIYIDPPYNTWNDSFNYNDRFNHSTWLTFMKNRLEVARELLRDDGVIFVQCDDNEQAYLKVLMDDIFKSENFISTLVWENKEWGWKSDSKFFRNKHEYMHVYSKRIERAEIFWLGIENEERYKLWDEHEKIRWKYYLQKLWMWTIQYSSSLDYEIETPDWTKITPAENNNWKKACWRWSESKLKWWFKNDFVVIKKDSKNIWTVYTKQYLKSDNEWNIIERKIQPIGIISKYSTTQSSKHLKEIFWDSIFNYSKPEWYIEYVLSISTNPWDIVLDYHLGSGTTAAVAHKMGRQYIGVEQMDYIETISVERMKKVIEGEQGGVSKSVEWKGGWEFVYMEMMEANQRYLDKISGAKDTKTLLALYKEIQESGFINYYVDIKTIDENISEFEALSLENQKRFLAELLDKNLLYVNHSEVEDVNYGVSDEDKELNREFYK